MNTNDYLAREHTRLAGGQPPAGGRAFATARLLADCPGNAERVLARCRQVLGLVSAIGAADWSEEVCRQVLPRWFVEACAPEQTAAEAQAWVEWWRTLPAAEQARAEDEKRWSCDNWLYQMEPSRRTWFWRAGVVLSPNSLSVEVEVTDWPFPWGSLNWLLRASGATAVRYEPDG